MSEALKSNTTLKQLNLSSEDKIKKTQRHSSTIHSFSFLFTSTGNDIGESGATSLSEVLKSNTTLTKLNLSCEDKRRHTKGIHQQFTLSFLFISTDNSIGDTGASSLSEALKSNTTLTKLDLRSEDRRHAKTSINNSLFLFSSRQQGTVSKKEEQHH